MSIPNGTRLGPYEIVRPIGAGGMGEVYRATDTRLRRDVAIKILPQSYVADANRLARFEQEARATAALRHPNVLTIHDFGTDGVPYLVTELLDGETLAEALAGGPVSLRRAMGWSLQILRAMSAAHLAGIIHRDLKPANIFITTDGTVKVLDFGLAKVLDDREVQRDTPTVAYSAPGVVVGTIGYMSPEQVRGEPVDARSDIFSFAVVLHQMLTGSAPFVRGNSAETMSAILRDDPPRLETPPHPRVLAETVLRCLDKSPDARFHSAHDLALHLETIDLGGSSSAPAVVGLATSSEAIVSEGTLPAPPAPHQVTFHSGNILRGRFAPDGSIVYGASWGEAEPEVFVSHRGMPESRPLGIRGSIHAVSRNGELAVSLERRNLAGFLSIGTLGRVPIAGGSPRPIANDVHEADWAPDGRQLAVARRAEKQFRIEYPIGRVLYESSSWFSHLRISPAGDCLAFMEHPLSGDNFGHVMTVDLTGRAKRMTDDLYISWGLAWHPTTGEIWYSAAPVNSAHGRTIMIYAVDMAGRSREVFSSLGNLFLQDIAADGTVLATQELLKRNMIGHVDGIDRDLTWFDWSLPARLSGDGKTLLFEEQGVASGGRNTIYLRETSGSPAIRLDEGRGRDLSSDGQCVLAISNDSPERLLVIPTGAGEVEEIPIEGLDHFVAARYVPGEREIVLVGSNGGQGTRLWRIDAQGGQAHPISDEGIAHWFFLILSPDGEWAAVVGKDPRPVLYPLHGDGGAVEIKGAQTGDVPLHWLDEDHLYVSRVEEKRAVIVEINLRTGERNVLRTITAPSPAGVQGIGPILFSDDGQSYVFGYRLILSSLFVVTGIR